jgi:nitrate reductase NapE
MQRRIDQQSAAGVRSPASARSEILVFLLLAVVVWPVLTVGVVGGYGFAVWMQQQVFGPPDVSHGR